MTRRTDPIDEAVRLAQIAGSVQRLLDRGHTLDAAVTHTATAHNIDRGINVQQELHNQPLDMVDDLLLRAEAIRHIFRDAMDADVGDTADAAALMQRLDEWLPRISQSELGKLVDRSTRQLQRWKKEGGAATHRLALVTRLVALLRTGWSQEGVVAWFSRRLPALDGRTPLQLLDEPAAEQELIEAARRGRAQTAS